MPDTFLRRVGSIAVGALFLWSCGGGSSSPTGPSSAGSSVSTSPATVTVAIVSSTGNGAFAPNPVRANTGDTVVFRNNDRVVHRLVMNDGSGDLGDIAPGTTSRGLTVRNANASNFHCTLHPSMVGSINGALPPSDCVPDIYGYGCS